MCLGVYILEHESSKICRFLIQLEAEVPNYGSLVPWGRIFNLFSIYLFDDLQKTVFLG